MVHRFRRSAVRLGELLLILAMAAVSWQILPAGVSADSEGLEGKQAYEFMRELDCANGYEDGLPHLDDMLTRAQAVTLFVRCMGQESAAKRSEGAPSFPDTSGHWASGAIAVAKNQGLVDGFPDGTFRPDGNITLAQFLKLLVHVLGLNRSSENVWPEDVIEAAIQSGLMPTPGLRENADRPVTRGQAFYYANTAFMKVSLPSGGTFYQTYTRRNPPTLEASASAAVTSDSAVTISGRTARAGSVTCGGVKTELGTDGSFSCRVPLAAGVNTIEVAAADLVNHIVRMELTVERIAPLPGPIWISPSSDVPGTPAAITADRADLSVASGASAPALQVTVRDARGRVIRDAAITASVSPADLGAFDPATGIFTAGTKARSGTLTLHAGSAELQIPVAVTPGPLDRLDVLPASATLNVGDIRTFAVRGFDRFGNPAPVADAVWSASGSGAVMDATTGTFMAARAGTYTVKVSAGGISASADVMVTATYSIAVFPPDGAVLYTGQEKTVTFTVYDNRNVPVSGVPVRFAVYGSLDPAGLGLTSAVTDADGAITVSYAAVQPGEGNLVLTVDRPGGTSARTGLIRVLPMPRYILIDPESDPLLSLLPGQSGTITFRVLTAGEKPVAGATLDLTVSGPGMDAGILSAASVTTDPNGLAQVRVTNNRSGQGEITASVRGTDVSETTAPVILLPSRE
jgi:hypothetical protein